MENEKIVKEKKPSKSELADMVGLLAAKVGELAARVDALTPKPAVRTPAFKETNVETPANALPVPSDYRAIVDTVLNSAFGVEVVACSDRPSFQFVIVVPETYSNASPAWREMYREDRRSRVIDYAIGVNGVREYAELVFKNFSHDTQTRIVTDRINAKTYANA